MKPHVMFLDYLCPRPYSLETLRAEGMGGTEATVVRVAEYLAKHLSVSVVQHNRAQSEGIYHPLRATLPTPTHVVHLRSPHAIAAWAMKYPNAKRYLWLHDLPGHSLTHDNIVKYPLTIIPVSEFHKTACIDFLLHNSSFQGLKFKRIYNPIDEGLTRYRGDIKRNKLVFFSSPQKGLDITLDYFVKAKRILPDIELYLSNPGYFTADLPKIEGVVDLGILPHSEILAHVKEALCVFYPNYRFPETFGLVLAEANAVGTPVLTHPFGAASEVLEHPGQFVDCRDFSQVVSLLSRWYNGERPIVGATEEFRMNHVGKQWIRLLNS